MSRADEFDTIELTEMIANVARDSMAIHLVGPRASLKGHGQMFDYGKKFGLAITYKYLESAYWRETKTAATEHVPATWWQAVRERWLPIWWVARWPVRKRAIPTATVVKEFHVCPHVAIPDRDGDKIHFAYLNHPRLKEGRL